MSEQQKKELEHAMHMLEEARAAEARGQQLAMEKAGELAEGIAVEVTDGTKKVNKAIEMGTVTGYKAIENGVVSGYKAIEKGVVGGFNKITDKFVGVFLTKEGETVEQAKERLAAEQKAREEQHAERMQACRKNGASGHEE